MGPLNRAGGGGGGDGFDRDVVVLAGRLGGTTVFLLCDAALFAPFLDEERPLPAVGAEPDPSVGWGSSTAAIAAIWAAPVAAKIAKDAIMKPPHRSFRISIFIG
jgi:hypothetical protein